MSADATVSASTHGAAERGRRDRASCAADRSIEDAVMRAATADWSPSRSADQRVAGAAEAQAALTTASSTGCDVGRRLRDHAQDLGGGRLLLERFAQFGEQADVLDGDHGLGGEGLEELDLLVGEALGLAAHGTMTPIGSPSRSIGTASSVRAAAPAAPGRGAAYSGSLGDVGDMDDCGRAARVRPTRRSRRRIGSPARRRRTVPAWTPYAAPAIAARPS